MANTILSVKNLKVYFEIENNTLKAVDDVSFTLKEKQIVGLVGESGCGKSVTSLSIMRLISEPGKIKSGEIIFSNKDLLKLNKNDMRHIRGNEIAMIFQEPMTSLNPVIKIGEQMEEPFMVHKGMTRHEAYDKAVELIKKVNIPRPDDIMKCYPHQLSGGMLQRVMIAIALSLDPKLLIADEPTTALDVTIQAQILDILREVKDNFNTSILLITHDLGVVAETCDHVLVMYAGKIIEEANVIELFKNPKHPYTQGLLKSKPVIGRRQEKLYSIPGQVPNLSFLKESCYFYERCGNCMDICKSKVPPLYIDENGHEAACFLYDKEKK